MSSGNEEATPNVPAKAELNAEGFPSFSEQDIGEAWTKCAACLEQHDHQSVQSWKEEIDTLLVFAGLFSAVLTAFNVQSYQLLQPNPSPDATIVLLAQISTQLSSFSVNAGFINSTVPPLASAAISSVQAQPVLSSSVRINALWFSSLICSLSAASIGIMVKQWLSRFTNMLANASRPAARTRQLRNESMKTWRVANIIMILPILLQGSLVLFLAGLLELLWTLNDTVATVATVFVACLGVFQLFTTVLPAFVPTCPYQSPQALAFYIFVMLLKAPAQKWRTYLGWTGHQLDDSQLVLYNKNWWAYTWAERERELVDEFSEMLDVRMLIAADLVLADDTFLETAIRPCLGSMEPSEAAQSLVHIVGHCTRTQVFSSTRILKWDRRVGVFLNLVVDVMSRLEDGDSLDDATKTLLQFLEEAVYLIIHDRPTLQRLHDVMVTLLSKDTVGNTIHSRAFSVIKRINHLTGQISGIKFTANYTGLRAIARYIRYHLDNERISPDALGVLLRCASRPGCVLDAHLRAVHAELLQAMRDCFQSWDPVPLVDHPRPAMLRVGSCFVKLAHRVGEYVDSELIEELIKMFSRYEAMPVFTGEDKRDRAQTVPLLRDLQTLKSNLASSQDPSSEQANVKPSGPSQSSPSSERREPPGVSLSTVSNGALGTLS